MIVAGFAASRIKPTDTKPPTSEELYSRLYPLLNNIEYVAPSRVVGVNDPDQDGLLVVEQTAPESMRRRLQTAQIRIDLANQPRMGLALPKDHWIELGFDGPIRNGSGPDLLLRVQGCRSLLRVFVTDGASRLYELRRSQCLRIGVCRREHILDFDLDGLDLPFEPRAVRLLGAINWGPYGGIRFYSVQARIQREEPAQP